MPPVLGTGLREFDPLHSDQHKAGISSDPSAISGKTSTPEVTGCTSCPFLRSCRGDRIISPMILIIKIKYLLSFASPSYMEGFFIGADNGKMDKQEDLCLKF